MSEVRRGRDTLLDRDVAVKLLRAVPDRKAQERFAREARILARLQHPNIVTVFDAGTDRNERFIVMELIEGPTLRELLDWERRLDAHRTIVIAYPIAAALEYAHERGVVHRDIKPSNVLLSAAGPVKLADLGIAKILTDTDATKTTDVLGTFSYVAPEQARGASADGRADLYSLGCVMFEMLAGGPPFQGESVAVVHAHTTEPPPRLSDLAPDTPPELASLVMSLLAKDPSARPSVREVQDVLRGPELGVVSPSTGIPAANAPTAALAVAARTSAARTDRVPAATAGRRAPPRWKRFVPVIGVVAALLGLLVIATVLTADEAPPRRRDGESAQPERPPTREPSARAEASEQPQPTSPPEPASPRDAAGAVVAVLGDGIAAGEVRGAIVGEVHKKIEEILRELPKDGDTDKALEKIADLRVKIAEALEKGEITSANRATELVDALDRFAASLS